MLFWIVCWSEVCSFSTAQQWDACAAWSLSEWCLSFKEHVQPLRYGWKEWAERECLQAFLSQMNRSMLNEHTFHTFLKKICRIDLLVLKILLLVAENMMESAKSVQILPYLKLTFILNTFKMQLYTYKKVLLWFLETYHDNITWFDDGSWKTI